MNGPKDIAIGLPIAFAFWLLAVSTTDCSFLCIATEDPKKFSKLRFSMSPPCLLGPVEKEYEKCNFILKRSSILRQHNFGLRLFSSSYTRTATDSCHWVIELLESRISKKHLEGLEGKNDFKLFHYMARVLKVRKFWKQIHLFSILPKNELFAKI